MKKILQILLLSIGLTGCASLVLEPVSSSQDETQRILALGLTHAENLIEAGKLKDNHTISVVTGQLMQAEDDKNKAAIDAVNISKYAESVKVLNDDSQIRFEGVQMSEVKRVGMLDDYDYQDYFLKGLKNKNTGLIQHQLNLKLKYTWSQRKNYSSASFCDKWQGCENAEKLDITLISSSASSCTPDVCDYSEIMELKLSDDFLKNNMEDGFTVSFNSKKSTNKITIASDYLKGYLKIAN
ncbi:hypothetical protein [Candidatus Pseudothioglobus sp. Uisw_016]|uniref:hypothetical protein n=1 Tax=Candidatus Pseudothioglobus sp. Uisw_016 TaxID=3230995 RepID=UPI003A85BCBF